MSWTVLYSTDLTFSDKTYQMKVYTLFISSRLKNKDKHSLNRYCVIKIYVNNASIKPVGTRLRRLNLLWLSLSDRGGLHTSDQASFTFTEGPCGDMETVKSGIKSRGARMRNIHAMLESNEIIGFSTVQHIRRISLRSTIEFLW